MEILLICNKSPWPPHEGGPIAMNAMVEGLLEAGHNVKVLAINSHKYNVDINTIPADYRKKTNIELVHIDLRVRLIPAMLNWFTKSSYHVNRFISDDFSTALKHILTKQRFDVIQLESLFITPYLPLIRQLSDAPVILRAHNIEHLIWLRLYRNEKNLIRKHYLKHLSHTLMKYELKAITEVDGIVAITPMDANYFAQHMIPGKVISIPFGIMPGVIERYSRKENKQVNKNTLFHLGSMNWLPNQEGIRWFLREVWPLIHHKNKNLTFHLAGREMPVWLQSLKTNKVVIDGEVPDAIKYMHEHQIMVVPLFSGSGIRIKIIEGMMAGCTIITTSIGAEGINYIDGKHLIIANSSQEFIEAINALVSDPVRTAEIGQHASLFVIEQHNNRRLIQELESFYRQHIN